MAEARPEEEEENMRESVEQVVRRQNGSGGRSDRRKPEHRHSQGPLSSIRAAIKRTSNRSTSLSETTPRDRERERDRERDRRRPEITILSAEPLSSWFPGAGFPPPPPPAAQIWGPTLAPSVLDIQPPPSYEEVIREKNQEQVVIPAAAAHPPSLTSLQALSVSTTTIATQTDAGATKEKPGPPQVCRPSRPPRPSLPGPASTPIQTPASSDAVQPRPRPRSKLNLQPVRDEVKVQTLVKLREDGLRTLAARAKANDQVSNQEALGGKYLQELLEAFSSDDWGFPEQRSASQSESEDEPDKEVTEQEQEEGEDMATLRARIQAFEQMHDGSPGEVPAQRPEPKPRPRVTQTKPPTVAPKPKILPMPTDVLSSKTCNELWEDGGRSGDEAEISEPPEKPTTASKPELSVEEVPVPVARSCGSTPPPQPKHPPRPSIVPRTAPRHTQDRGPSAGQKTPPLPPRPTADPRTRVKTEVVNGEEGAAGTVKVAVPRPGVPSKPVVTRRSSVPHLDSGPVPCRPSGPPRPGPAPALRKSAPVQSSSLDPALAPRSAGAKLLPLRPPPIKSLPGRPPPPSVLSTSNPPPALNKSPSSPSLLSEASTPANQTAGNAPGANQTPSQRASRKGPPLPPRPRPGQQLHGNLEKQEVLIVLDDQSPAPSEPGSQSNTSSGPAPPSVQLLLDLDLNLGPDRDEDQNRTKAASEGLAQTPDILSLESEDETKPPESTTLRGARYEALFDFEAALDDELSFCRGDVISLLELIGGDGDWGRGQLNGRIGLFPLSFTQMLEPLPTVPPPGESGVTAETGGTERTESGSSSNHQDALTEEWAVALFDFPGQTAGDLSFQKGALIRVLEHVDAEWRRGRAERREGLYPAAFTQTCAARPITDSNLKATALFDFTAENVDELTLRVGDVLTHVEPVDEQWFVGEVGGKRGIIPKNFISLVT